MRTKVRGQEITGIFEVKARDEASGRDLNLHVPRDGTEILNEAEITVAGEGSWQEKQQRVEAAVGVLIAWNHPILKPSYPGEHSRKFRFQVDDAGVDVEKKYEYSHPLTPRPGSFTGNFTGEPVKARIEIK